MPGREGTREEWHEARLPTACRGEGSDGGVTGSLNDVAAVGALPDGERLPQLFLDRRDVDGVQTRLAHHDVTFTAVSRAPRD